MPADRPYRTRPLAGVDQALAEGQAREPAELLDELRERLNRLAPNHPSARREPADASPVPEPESEPAGPTEEVPDSGADRSSLPKNGADRSGGYRLGNHGAGQPPAVDREPAVGPEPAAGPEPADDQYRVVDIGRRGPGEPYRPWFADEPGSPWFME